ncbi:MAG: iron-sulfur cluster assembly accessory protein [Gammaproteobacteria bacterium]|nr:MAG: iron-sulfur cluster assembly accessory protein [Gammaproteobacteria bacterium]
MSIHLTESAAQHIASMLEKQPLAVGLRLGVRKAGCTGYAYVIDFADSVETDDQVYETSGVKVVVNEAHLPFLKDVEVDYRKTGLNTAFHFNNPNVTDTCGCGESFAIKETES